MSGDSLTVAVAQVALTPGDKERNLEIIAERAGRAAEAGAQLVVFPELALTGYGLDAGRIAELAEACDGPGAARIAQAARQSGIAVCYGFAERAPDGVYNAAALIGPDGALLAHHRKTHLFGDSERRLFALGQRPVTLARVAGTTVGLLICYEAEFPELVRRVVLAGAELLAVPTATMSYGPQSRFSEMLIATRAIENNCFIAYSNYCGDDGHYRYMGKSIVAGPLTDVYALAGAGEELLVAQLDKARLAEGEAKISYRRDRRPELYGED